MITYKMIAHTGFYLIALMRVLYKRQLKRNNTYKNVFIII